MAAAISDPSFASPATTQILTAEGRERNMVIILASSENKALP